MAGTSSAHARSLSEALGQARQTTPRRGREGGTGTGISPKAKRPNVLETPAPMQLPGGMSTQEIISMLHTVKAQQDQIGVWAQSVNATLDNHADGLEGAHKEFLQIRGEIRQSAEAADQKTESIAQRVAELFKKTDELLASISGNEGQLRTLIDARLVELQTRLAEMELAGTSGSATPPGLVIEGIQKLEGRADRLEDGIKTVDQKLEGRMWAQD